MALVYLLSITLAVVLVVTLASIAPAAAQTWILSAPEARDQAINGDALLIDIRRPNEWRDGAGDVAVRNSMHESGFIGRLEALTAGDRDRRIALICATGGRSAFLAHWLRSNGYTQVYDVSEGMYGSAAGPGWLERGLPTVVQR